MYVCVCFCLVKRSLSASTEVTRVRETPEASAFSSHFCSPAMALPSRVSAALSDIFLPAHSIYNKLDNPQLAEADDDDPIASMQPSSSGHSNRSSHPHERLAMNDDDPFSSVSPSMLSPARSRAVEPPLAPPPHSESSRPASQQRFTADGSIPDIDQRLEHDDDARADPFQVEEEAHVEATPRSSRSRSRSPTPTTSIYLPASGSPDKPADQAPISPASSTRTRGSQGAMSASRSALGNRSLMGLMGGTRYEGGGFPFGGIGVDEEEEEEEDRERQEGDPFRGEESHRANAKPDARSSELYGDALVQSRCTQSLSFPLFMQGDKRPTLARCDPSAATVSPFRRLPH